MSEKSKHVLMALSLLILLPYVVTVFMKGEGEFYNFNPDEKHVTVQVNGIETPVLWDEFLLGVVAREIPLTYSYEAMKAQTVMARTRLVKEAEGVNNYVYKEMYFTAEEIQQKWKHLEPIEVYGSLKAAVQDTQGEVLTFDGQYIETPYHLLSNGTTRSGADIFTDKDYPYLTSVNCRLDAQNKDKVAVKKIEYQELVDTLDLKIKENNIKWDKNDIMVQEKDESNYVKNINIKGQLISGETFRKKLGLPSSAIELEVGERELIIKTEGIGHGIGLSQNTAHYMGLEQISYDNILAYFYKNTKIILKK